MKRLHIHVKVTDLKQAIDFYSSLFAMKPTVTKDDYAKWMVEDPRVNFAVSTTDAAPGLSHFGIQAEDENELADVYGRLAKAGRPVLEEGRTTCCYADQEKAWIADPDALPWETFLTFGDSTVYGERGAIEKLQEISSGGENRSGVCCR